MEFLAQYGYAGLFASSFLAATVLPVGSEVLLTLLIINKYDIFIILTVATIGNVLGSLINYIAGIKGGNWIMTKILRLSESEIEKAERWFKKYGNSVLLFAWVPIVGDPLTVVAGILKTDLTIFIILVTIGKFMRYLFIALIFI